MKYTLLLLFLLMCCAAANGRNTGDQRIDSLKAALANSPSAAVRAGIMQSIAEEYRIIDPREELAWARRLLTLAMQSGIDSTTADAQELIGDSYSRLGSQDSALTFLRPATAFYKRSGNEKKLAKTMYRMGYALKLQGNLPGALELGFAALKMAEDRSYLPEQDAARLLIGDIYNDQNDFPKARKYLHAAIAGMQREGNGYNIASAYTNLAMLYEKYNASDSARACYLAALHGYQAVHSETGELGTLQQMANLALRNHSYTEAFTDAKAAEALAIRTNDTLSLLYVLSTYGDIDLSMGLDTEKFTPAARINAIRAAAGYYRQVRKQDNRIDDISLLANIANNLSQADSALGSYREAYSEYKRYILLRDSVSSDESRAKIARLSRQREEDLKQKRIEVQELQIRNAGLQRLFLIAGLVMLAGIGGLTYRQSRQRRKANDALQLLNTKLDSNNRDLDEANRVKTRFFGILTHDLRAPVARLSGFLALQREAPELMDEHEKTAHNALIETSANNLLAVMEDLLLWSKGQMQQFRPQLHWVNAAQLFESIRLLLPAGDGPELLMVDEEKLRLYTDEHFLKTIMRNLTANALKAVAGKPQARITWKAWNGTDGPCLSVTDNGKGMSSEAVMNLFTGQHITSTQTGLGLHIIRDFAQLLGIKIVVESEVGIGTTITLIMAVRLQEHHAAGHAD